MEINVKHRLTFHTVGKPFQTECDLKTLDPKGKPIICIPDEEDIYAYDQVTGILEELVENEDWYVNLENNEWMTGDFKLSDVYSMYSAGFGHIVNDINEIIRGLFLSTIQIRKGIKLKASVINELVDDYVNQEMEKFFDLTLFDEDREQTLDCY